MIAKIVEIFHSLQGEGLLVGEETTFVRFLGCNLCCRYCDTLYARDEEKVVAMTERQVCDLIHRLTAPGQFISLTGGEPLLWADFLMMLCPNLKKMGFRIYLETNGTLVEEMKKVSHLMDIVAMDIKAPSDCGQELWSLHEKFLETVKDKSFVKLVITSTILPQEVHQTVALLKKIDPGISLVLQPATGELAPEMDQVRRYQAEALRVLRDVRIIHQMHKRWALR